jgi:hypothetical protein
VARSTVQPSFRAYTAVKLSPRSSTLEDALELMNTHKVMIYSKVRSSIACFLQRSGQRQRVTSRLRVRGLAA